MDVDHGSLVELRDRGLAMMTWILRVDSREVVAVGVSSGGRELRVVAVVGVHRLGEIWVVVERVGVVVGRV